MNDFSALGEKLKSTRNKMGLSLSDVALKTGVSKTMLSQIERSESIPTLATVWKIANGLKIKFETLLDYTSKQYGIKSINNMTPLKDEDENFLIYCIVPFSPISGFECFYGIIKPGAHYPAVDHKNSIKEYLTIFQGELELTVGKAKYNLKAGDSIEFDPTENHIYTNHGEVDTHAHFIVSYS